MCITADIWSESRRSYMGATCHFLNEDLDRKAYAIACRRMRGSHTFDAVAKILNEIMEDWAIQYKTCGVVTDNATNFAKGVPFMATQQSQAPSHPTRGAEEVADETEEDEDETQGEDDEGQADMEFTSLEDILANPLTNDVSDDIPEHFRCAAHTLSLIAKVDSEKAMTPGTEYYKLHRSSFGKLQAIWNKFKRSTKFADFYHERFDKVLITPVETRWNSTFDSVVRVLELFEEDPEAFCAIMVEAKTRPVTLDEVAFLKEYKIVNEPIARALDYLQGEQYMFMGYLIPTMTSVKTHLGTARTKVNTCKPLVDVMLEAVQQRFGALLEDRKAIISSTYLPAFKLFWIDDPEEKAKSKKLLLEEVMKIDPQAQPLEPSASTSGDFFPKRPRMVDTPEEEVDRFLADVSCDTKSVLAYRRVREVFRKFNTNIPSSAPSERLFSHGKFVFRPNRHRMHDSNFEMQLLMKINKVM